MREGELVCLTVVWFVERKSAQCRHINLLDLPQQEKETDTNRFFLYKKRDVWRSFPSIYLCLIVMKINDADYKYDAKRP